jgi:hypothetical protein
MLSYRDGSSGRSCLRCMYTAPCTHSTKESPHLCIICPGSPLLSVAWPNVGHHAAQLVHGIETERSTGKLPGLSWAGVVVVESRATARADREVHRVSGCLARAAVEEIIGVMEIARAIEIVPEQVVAVVPSVVAVPSNPVSTRVAPARRSSSCVRPHCQCKSKAQLSIKY